MHRWVDAPGPTQIASEAKPDTKITMDVPRPATPKTADQDG